LLGNVLLERYFKDTSFAKNALAAEDLGRFRSMADLFRKYASEYDFDWLMVAAHGYQESGLDQSVRSAAGAIGVMQLLKSTASDRAVEIPDIEQLEPNIHAGAEYLRHLANRYFADLADDPFNQTLFVFAGYNAGPNRIAELRAKAGERGLDPDVWFRSVEVLAAEEIGRETVQYVSNIYKYHVVYRLVADRLEAEWAASRT
jgi:membrane-bound lytic murein transglycosylase MltF